jgi:hypothetical protein
LSSELPEYYLTIVFYQKAERYSAGFLLVIQETLLLEGEWGGCVEWSGVAIRSYEGEPGIKTRKASISGIYVGVSNSLKDRGFG